MKTKKLAESLKWVTYVARRFSRVDRTGRSAVTSLLATLGICFGVMTLIVVMSVMNGFQMSFIDSILEISSYHVRVTDLSPEFESDFIEYCAANKYIKHADYFYEAQSLMTGKKGGVNSVLIRAISKDSYRTDEGFSNEVKLVSGSFDLSAKNSIVIGSTLARTLGVRVGDNVTLMVMSGGSDVELFSSHRVFTVTGIFSSGYKEINNAYAFVSHESAREYFGEKAKKQWGIKLTKYYDDMHINAVLEKFFLRNSIPAKVLSWRDYNKTFFGTLRIEKNMLLLLVTLIFVVVAINIYNGMRRLVFERKSEIAILSALGAGNWEIKSIFIIRGLVTGFLGAAGGLILGILISKNTDIVFNIAAKVMYGFQYLYTAITDSNNLVYVRENSSYSLYASIPARIFPKEVAAITLFGVLAPFIASWAASRNVLKMTVSEVLHNE